jgi:hypothetical protein
MYKTPWRAEVGEIAVQGLPLAWRPASSCTNRPYIEVDEIAREVRLKTIH